MPGVGMGMRPELSSGPRPAVLVVRQERCSTVMTAARHVPSPRMAVTRQAAAPGGAG
jgi:hypothetical protein